MPHCTTTTARSFDLYDVTFTSYVSSASGATRLAAWRADIAARTPGRTHSMSQEECLYVLTGELDIEIEDERFTAGAGDAVLVPAGASFRMSNDTDRPAQVWVTTLLGMTATLDGGDQLAPPWAQ